MNNNLNYQDLTSMLLGLDVKWDFSLKSLNRYGTGGNARVVVFPTSSEELKYTIDLVKGKFPYCVIGGGSNLLVSDKGFDGIVISTLKVNRLDLKGNLLTCDCGVKMTSAIKEMQDNCFSGLEFAVGIPATVGGAVAMNAGCYGKSIADAVKYVVTENGVYTNSECGFTYRSSRFLNGETVIKVCFLLEPSEEDLIEERIKSYKGFRKNPKGKSCGSVFKNDGYFAGKIIDEVGLKGYKRGGARVSNEHANFIIADDNCTSQDVYNLIKYIKEKVYSKKQIELIEEIVYLGEF